MLSEQQPRVHEYLFRVKEKRRREKRKKEKTRIKRMREKIRSCSARFCSSMFVQVPNHFMRRPSASGTGSARTRCQQYSPVRLRRRHSISNAPSTASALAHSFTTTSWSTGCATLNHPPPALLSGERLVTSLKVEVEEAVDMLDEVEVEERLSKMFGEEVRAGGCDKGIPGV